MTKKRDPGPMWPTAARRERDRRRNRAERLALGSKSATPGHPAAMADIAKALTAIRNPKAPASLDTPAVAVRVVYRNRDKGRAWVNQGLTGVRVRWNDEAWACDSCGRSPMPACKHALRVAKELRELDRKASLKDRSATKSEAA